MDKVDEIADLTDRAEMIRRMRSHGIVEEVTVTILICNLDGDEDERGDALGPVISYSATIGTTLLVDVPQSFADYSEVFERENGSMLILLDGSYPEKFVSDNRSDVLRDALDRAYAHGYDYVLMNCEDDDRTWQITLDSTPEREQMRAALRLSEPILKLDSTADSHMVQQPVDEKPIDIDKYFAEHPDEFAVKVDDMYTLNPNWTGPQIDDVEYLSEYPDL